MSSPTSQDEEIRRLLLRIQRLEAENLRLTTQLVHARTALFGPQSRSAPMSPQSARPASSPTKRAAHTSRSDPEATVISSRPIEPDPGEEVCGNCGKCVPKSSASMHLLHCTRHTAKCSACGVAFPVKDLPSHLAAAAGSPFDVNTAAASADLPRLTAMLQHGVDVHASCDETTGDAIIHVGARHGHKSVIDFALSAGESINAANSGGETALHIACSRWRAGCDRLQCTSFVQYLLERGCDADARTVIGDTPIQVAQRCSFNDALLLLATVGGSLRPSSRDSLQRPASATTLRRLSSAPPTMQPLSTYSDCIAPASGTSAGIPRAPSSRRLVFGGSSPELIVPVQTPRGPSSGIAFSTG